jgi:hypothetical protein
VPHVVHVAGVEQRPRLVIEGDDGEPVARGEGAREGERRAARGEDLVAAHRARDVDGEREVEGRRLGLRLEVPLAARSATR